MKITTYDPRKDKDVTVGVYETSSGIFTKTVSARHFMRVEKGYGIQESVIVDLAERNCKVIKIKVKNDVYAVGFETWRTEGAYVDYGHGSQCFYPLKMMNKETK